MVQVATSPDLRSIVKKIKSLNSLQMDTYDLNGTNLRSLSAQEKTSVQLVFQSKVQKPNKDSIWWN